MAKITGVSVDFDETLPFFEAAVIVHIHGKQTIFLSLEPMANDPVYAVLRDKERILNVKTDGNSIFWPPDGPRLTFDEIMDALREGASDG